MIEDCAHSIYSKYKNKFLGTIGDLGAFSFHETKNFPAGQGGALSVNNSKLIKKATIYCDKGTDRSFIGKKGYYSWKDGFRNTSYRNYIRNYLFSNFILA